MNTAKGMTLAMCMLAMVSCQTKQGTGTIIGSISGTALGGIVGKIAGNTAVGAAIGGVVGAGAGALIGRHMDNRRVEVYLYASQTMLDAANNGSLK